MSVSEYYDSDEEIDWTGQILKNRYVLVRMLGSGGFSTVWLAKDFADDIFVAIKIVHSSLYDSGVQEAEILTKLNKTKNNKRVVKIYNKFEHNDNYCLVLELMGVSLYDVIRSHRTKIGGYTLPKDFIDRVVGEIKQGIEDIHSAGYMHRDIKPENILFDYVDTTKLVNTEFTSYFEKAKLKHIKKMGVKNKYIATMKAFSEASKKVYSESDDEDVIEEDVNFEDNNNYIYSREDIVSSCSESDENEDEDFDKNIYKSSIKINDFGHCGLKSDNEEFDIQTQYYRAPEVIYNIPYTEEIDIWSLKCMEYELRTGQLLFDTRKYQVEEVCEDEYHLNLFK